MSEFLLHRHSDAADAQQDVEVALLHDAYDRLRQSLFMTVVVTCMFAGLLWPFFPAPLMTIWMITAFTVLAARYLLWISFQSARSRTTVFTLWRNLFVVGAAAAGASWALGPTLMMPEAGSAESALFIGALLSVCAVAISTLASQQAAMQAFLVAALAPPAVAIWRTGGDVERVAAAAERTGARPLELGRKCIGFEQDEAGVTLRFEDGSSVRGADWLTSSPSNSAPKARYWRSVAARPSSPTTLASTRACAARA